MIGDPGKRKFAGIFVLSRFYFEPNCKKITKFFLYLFIIN